MDQWVTVAEAARILKLSGSRVHQLIQNDQLPAEQHGSVWFIRRKDVEAFAALPEGTAGHPRTLKRRRRR